MDRNNKTSSTPNLPVGVPSHFLSPEIQLLLSDALGLQPVQTLIC